MSRYTKVAVTIEAWRWLFSPEQEPEPTWLKDAAAKWPEVGGISLEPDHADGPRIAIATLEGVMTARPGDWILQGVKGELYPCKHDIFEQTYRRARSSAREPVSREDEKKETLALTVRKLVDAYVREIDRARDPRWAMRQVIERLVRGSRYVKHDEEDAVKPIPGSLNGMAVEVNAINRANGWNVLRPEEWEGDQYHIPTVLALIHSEVSEALEAFRRGDRENFAEEIADTVIRCLDCAGGLGIDLDSTIAAKLEKNRNRGHKHGGKRV